MCILGLFGGVNSLVGEKQRLWGFLQCIIKNPHSIQHLLQNPHPKNYHFGSGNSEGYPRDLRLFCKVESTTINIIIYILLQLQPRHSVHMVTTIYNFSWICSLKIGSGLVSDSFPKFLHKSFPQVVALIRAQDPREDWHRWHRAPRTCCYYDHSCRFFPTVRSWYPMINHAKEQLIMVDHVWSSLSTMDYPLIMLQKTR